MTQSEEAQLVILLKKLEPSYYPLEIFKQFCRLNTLGIVEIVPFISGTNNTEVVLIKRPAEDEFWSNLYHTPGCIVRPTDTVEDALNRIIKEELGNPKLTEIPEHHGFVNGNSIRGRSLITLFHIQIEKPIIGETFKIDSLPENRIKGQDRYRNQ